MGIFSQRHARHAVAFVVAVGIVLALAPSALAESKRSLSYEYDVVWPTALRYFRIDQRAKLIEKDKEAGYLLFEIQHHNKPQRGTLEFIRRSDDRQSTTLILKMRKLPRYIEIMKLDGIEAKVRKEQGPPPPRTAEPKPKTKSPKSNDKDN